MTTASMKDTDQPTQTRRVMIMEMIDVNALHERIYALSARSHKSLEARTLKLAEEFGELAEAVSVVSGEDQYKGKTVEDIRLEVADVICCAMSIAQKAGISLIDINEALLKKSEKWERIINDLAAKS